MPFEDLKKIGVTQEILEETSYITKDRSEIYALMSVGCTTLCYEHDEKGVIVFCFNEKARCERILAKLKSKKLRVYAHDIIEVIDYLEGMSSNRRFKSKTHYE